MILHQPFEFHPNPSWGRFALSLCQTLRITKISKIATKSYIHVYLHFPLKAYSKSEIKMLFLQSRPSFKRFVRRFLRQCELGSFMRRSFTRPLVRVKYSRNEKKKLTRRHQPHVEVLGQKNNLDDISNKC